MNNKTTASFNSLVRERLIIQAERLIRSVFRREQNNKLCLLGGFRVKWLRPIVDNVHGKWQRAE